MRLRVATAAALTLAVVTAALWLGLDARAPVPPAFDSVRAGWKPSEVYLLDRSGEIIHEQRVDSRRRRLEWAALGAVSPALQSAVLASEDRRFHAHGGVDGRAIAAAALQRLSGRGTRGASTITMQLASLLDQGLRRHGGPRSLPQKVSQMRMAWAIEAGWSKPQILEAYLNLVTFSGELQGVDAASHVLFGKAPHGLTEPEALVLAERCGVDAAKVREALLGGFAGSKILEIHGMRMLARTFAPGFRVRLHQKDARIILEAARAKGSPIPSFEVVAGQLDRVAEQGGGELDHSALYTALSGD